MTPPSSGAHKPWHNLTVNEVCSLLAAPPAGLPQTEAAKRFADYGRNELRKTQRISPWAVFLEQFKNVLIAILLVAAAFLCHAVEAVAIASS